MKVRFALVAALGVLLVCASPARAEDKVKVKGRTRWKAGDVVTVTVQDTEAVTDKVLGADGKTVGEDAKTTETNVVYVLKCLEADATGHMTKAIVHFSEFAIALGADKDETLKGRTYRLEGLGKARKVAPIGDPTKSESETAMAWFAQELGPDARDDEAGDALEVDKPMGAGDSMPVSIKAFTTALGFPLPVDFEKSSGKVTYEAVAPDEVTVVTELALATKGFPGQDGNLLPWTEGGMMTIKMRGVAKPDGSAAPAEMSAEREWTGTTVDDAAGRHIVIKRTQKRAAKTIVGGQLPEAIEKPAEKPGEPPAPAPEAPKPEK